MHAEKDQAKKNMIMTDLIEYVSPSLLCGASYALVKAKKMELFDDVKMVALEGLFNALRQEKRIGSVYGLAYKIGYQSAVRVMENATTRSRRFVDNNVSIEFEDTDELFNHRVNDSSVRLIMQHDPVERRQTRELIKRLVAFIEEKDPDLGRFIELVYIDGYKQSHAARMMGYEQRNDGYRLRARLNKFIEEDCKEFTDEFNCIERKK